MTFYGDGMVLTVLMVMKFFLLFLLVTKALIPAASERSERPRAVTHSPGVAVGYNQSLVLKENT